MASGIRATVRFASANGCPIARIAGDVGTVVDQVSTSVSLSSGPGSVSEFLVTIEDPEQELDREPIFTYGSSHVFRITHGDDVGCPCECLGQFGCPVHRYIAAEGDLTLVFHAETFEALQEVMGDLQARFEGVDVQRLVQPPVGDAPEESVFVDRGQLTDRQLEVLETAYEMGYFDRPKRANATEIAAELGITQSTVTEHLAAAQSKLLGDVLEKG